MGTTRGPESAALGVVPVAERIGRTPDWLRRTLAANADEAGHRSHLVVGGVRVLAVRIGGRWAIPAAALDAALRGEAVA